MPSRRGSRGTSSSTLSSRRGGRGRIRKATCSRQAPQRYGQSQEAQPSSSGSGETLQQEAHTDEAIPSEYADSQARNPETNTPSPSSQSTIQCQSRIPISSSERDISLPPSRSGTPGISLDDMRDLLKSHEQDLIEKVVQQLRIPTLPATPGVQALDNGAAIDSRQQASVQLLDIRTMNRI